MLLKWAQTADPAAANQSDQVCIQSLETQLNDATQQLRQLRAEHAPNAADGQMAVQQSETNEQLEALHTANEEAHKAIAEMAAKRDSARKAYVQLQMQMLKDKAKMDAGSNALGVRCLQAEAEVMELKEKIGTLENRGGYHVSPTTTSATLRPYSQPAFRGTGSGLTAQASPQLGRGMSGLRLLQAPTPPSAGRGLTSYLARSSTRSLNSTPSPSPGTGSGLSTLVPGLYFRASAANAGHAQGSGRGMDTEGAGHAPGASTVTNGASSTTTNQGPAQAGSHISLQSN